MLSSLSIAKYSSAKVMFNDGTNQIPSQNQPGLDAEGIMWYKNGIWCDSETDTDEDELLDYMELLLGTNINNTDSDSDGLPDEFEGTITLFNGKPLYSNPLDPDTDDDGLPDGQEITFRIRPGAEPDEVYVFVWLHSDPNGDDSDGDGYTDNIDEHL